MDTYKTMKDLIIKKITETRSDDLDHILSNPGKIYTFLNPVSYLDAIKNKELFLHFDGIFSDGGLLCKSISLLYRKNVIRRSFDMTSVAPVLFEKAQKENKSVYIVAAKQEEVDHSVSVLREWYPSLNIIGHRNGYFSSDDEMNDEASKISIMSPDFLIVGMGAILQERFLVKAKNAGFKGIGFTCGGFIHQTALNEGDYYPAWAKDHFRFIYRMYKEPYTRKRYLKAAFLFPLMFLKELISAG